MNDPDPDQFPYWESEDRMFEAVHGCDGCCRPDAFPDGPGDPWEHDAWTAAWGRNAPLILGPLDEDYRLPAAPPGRTLLGVRGTVGGRAVVELTLLDDGGAILARGRCSSDPQNVDRLASQLLDTPKTDCGKVTDKPSLNDSQDLTT